jgi:hypothetical protein
VKKTKCEKEIRKKKVQSAKIKRKECKMKRKECESEK